MKTKSRLQLSQKNYQIVKEGLADAAKKSCLLSIRRKSVTKLKVTPKGRKKEKWAPKSIKHSFDVLEASGMRRERIRKKKK